MARTGSAAPRVVIDGRSGAGKSSLARALVARWPDGAPVQLLALDSIYPGWDGLAEGARIAADDVLAPHAAGRRAQWRRWDWADDRRAEAHVVASDLPLVVEGVGALTPASAALADVAVWLESPAASRRERALARDGEGYRPHWERWAAQEDAHIAAHDPRGLAGLVFEVP